MLNHEVLGKPRNCSVMPLGLCRMLYICKKTFIYRYEFTRLCVRYQMSALQHPVLNGMSPCKQYSKVAIVIIFLMSVAFHKNFSQSRMAYTYSVLQHTMAKVAKLLNTITGCEQTHLSCLKGGEERTLETK